MRSVICFSCYALLSIAVLSCHSGQRGTIQGKVTPATGGIRIMVTRGTATVATVVPDAQTGSFNIPVEPGTYDVSVMSTSSPFPIFFPGIGVAPDKPALLGTIVLASVKGTGTVSGRIRNGGAASRVSLLQDGQERAISTTDATGRYELKELPAGRYTLRVQTPEYADDARTVDLAGGQKVAMNIRMLYRTALDGIDWSRGTIRARGVGFPPPQAPTPSVRREMARRAALADAERNLLRVIDMIETGPGQKLSSSLGQAAFTRTIEGYVRGFHVAAERDLAGGKVEVEIELPLTGPGGLSSLLPAE